MHRRDSLWVRLVSEKYGCNHNVMPEILKAKQGSKVWQGLCGIWEKFLSSLKWEIWNGLSVRFWKDVWMPDGVRLIDVKSAEVPEHIIDMKVAQFFTDEGVWDIGSFSPFLPQEVVNRVVTHSLVRSEEDIPFWVHTSSNLFTVRSTYFSQVSSVLRNRNWIWKKLWKLSMP